MLEAEAGQPPGCCSAAGNFADEILQMNDQTGLQDIKTGDEGPIIEGESAEANIEVSRGSGPIAAPAKRKVSNQRLYLRYVFLPLILLTVALLGGLRLAGADGAFVFLKPPLVCLVFAAILLVLFFRANLLDLHGWLSDDFPLTKNAANAAVLLSLFAASAQLFNSLLPERGLPFWVVGFCFFWTLWNNLFAGFDTRKLLRSLGALFGLAFVVKYLLLANLTAPQSDGWLRSVIENPAQEAFTWLLDLPRFAPGTGYIQFFAVTLYLIGLFMLPSSTANPKTPLLE